jgi:hypothetical protein
VPPPDSSAPTVTTEGFSGGCTTLPGSPASNLPAWLLIGLPLLMLRPRRRG